MNIIFVCDLMTVTTIVDCEDGNQDKAVAIAAENIEDTYGLDLRKIASEILVDDEEWDGEL